jgi:hypothetical protein
VASGVVIVYSDRKPLKNGRCGSTPERVLQSGRNLRFGFLTARKSREATWEALPKANQSRGICGERHPLEL